MISIACGLLHGPEHYVMHALGRLWMADGRRVVWAKAYEADAELGVLHIDKTRLEGADLPKPPPGVRVINGQVLDISKRLFSVLEVFPDGDWDGPVIVKTNQNHFGLPEQSLASPPTGLADRLRARLAQRSWRLAQRLPDRHYPVLSSLKKVPGWVWDDPGYIVERFMPERVDGLYALRGWMFLGSASYGWRLFSAEHMVKTASMVRFEYIDEPPPELWELKARTGFDFGKFDYVIHDGKPVVLDLNKTPSLAGEGQSPRVRHLATGLMEFLK